MGRRALDVACGAGWGSLILAEAGATAVIGADVSDEALSYAQDHAGHAATFVLGDLAELPFGDGEFELAVCFETLEHLSDPERGLDEQPRHPDEPLVPASVLGLGLQRQQARIALEDPAVDE